MQHPRPTPFDLVFDETATETTLPRIRAALAAAGQDPRNRDAFLMQREVVSLLRELRPEEGLGEGIDQLAALVHHSYLFWEAGSLTVQLGDDQLRQLLQQPPELADPAGDQPPFYAQLPERIVWAQVVPGTAHEPLDGCFQYAFAAAGELRVLGVFGIHPERPGFSVVEVGGARPVALARPDDSPLYAPTLPGGAAARLFSLAGEEELLDLGWRLYELGIGSWELGAGRSGHPVSGS
jgi:hypothetical protein